MIDSKVVILGGGFGGLNVAQMLKGTLFDVTLIDKKNHHLFQPLLYQVASAALSPADIATPLREIFSRQSNISVVMATAENIDTQNHKVVLANGDLFLIIIS